jgi:hypothetical protein
MLKKYWRPETRIFLGLWLLLMIGGQSRFLQDPGTFWHTVVGQQMLSTRELIYHDSFSFTFAGHTWSPHQWLGECIMAILHRIDGLDTLLLVTVTALTCLYTWLAHRLIRGGLHWSLAVVMVGLTVAASSSHFHIRSHIATILFLGWTYGFLCDFEAGRGGIGRLFWLVPIYLFWTNVHGGMLGGLGTLGFALAGWCIARILGQASPMTDYRKALIFVALMGCCGLTIFINPYGLRMPQIWKQIMDGDLPQIILEHAPLNPAKPDGWMVLVFGMVYLIVLAGVWPKWPRVTWLLPLIWFYLACTRIRHAPLFSITAALAIADMLPHTHWAAWIARTGSDLFQLPREVPVSERPPLAWRPALFPACVLVAALLLQVERIPVPVMGHGWARLDPTYWPVELLPTLAAYQNSREGGTPIFNEYLHGGFLIYQTPGFRVFVDDRCELYGDQWLKDYVQAEEAETEKYVKEWERTYPEFDLALTRTGSGFDVYFATSRDWVLVQQSEAATLYRRAPVRSCAPRGSAGVAFRGPR